MSTDEQERLDQDYLIAVERQKELEKLWREYCARPFQVLQGPQYNAGNAPTPILSHNEVDNSDSPGSPDSPILVRQDSIADLRSFYQRSESVAMKASPGLFSKRNESQTLEVAPNDNNNYERPVGNK